MLLTVVTAAFVLGVDLWIKHLAQGLLTGERIVVLPGLLALQLSHNRGIALGLLQGNKIALLVLPILALLLCWLMLRKYHSTGYIRFAMGLVLGGFAGNYLERMVQGYVVDMLYFPFLPWFVCNIADVAVCFGVALLMFSLLLRPQDWREKNAKDRENSAD